MANNDSCAICEKHCHIDYNDEGYIQAHIKNAIDCKGACPYFPNLHYAYFADVTLV